MRFPCRTNRNTHLFLGKNPNSPSHHSGEAQHDLGLEQVLEQVSAFDVYVSLLVSLHVSFLRVSLHHLSAAKVKAMHLRLLRQGIGYCFLQDRSHCYQTALPCFLLRHTGN